MCDLSHLIKKIHNFDFKGSESARIFHGRGGIYKGFEDITVDWLSGIIFIRFFKEYKALEGLILNLFVGDYDYPICLHRQYNKEFEYINCSHKSLENYIVKHHGLEFIVKAGVNQNYGLFLDMNKGKDWIISHCEGKKILNLFSYTCAFSVIAKHYGATEIHNVDMSSSVLSWGRENHRVNNINMDGIYFHKKNIMKSLGWITKKGPFDIIIVDPPTFQSGGFNYKIEYARIIKRLDSMLNPGGFVLSCLNTPFEKSDFVVSLYKDFSPLLEFVDILYSSDEYEEVDKESGLKIVILKKG